MSQPAPRALTAQEALAGQALLRTQNKLPNSDE